MGKFLMVSAAIMQFLVAGSALAVDFKVVDGDGHCPTGYDIVTYDDAVANKSEACNMLGQWDIVRLAKGGSMGGPGYKCSTFPLDDRGMGSTLCRASASKVVKAAKSAKSCSDYGIDIDSRGRVASLIVKPRQFANVSQHKVLSEIAKNSIYKCFNDDFDFVFFVRNSQDMSNFSQFHMNTPNPLYWGSAGKLQGINVFPALGNIAFGATLHEIAHQWMNNIIPTWGYVRNNKTGIYEVKAVGKDNGSHWGISDVDGQMGGFDKSKLTLNNGVYTVGESFGWNNTGGNSKPYSALELYLMGLEQHPPAATTVYTNVTEYNKMQSDKIYSPRRPDGSRSYHYETYHQFRATPKVYSASDIEHLSKGIRPAYSASKTFRVLTVVLTQQSLNKTQWDEIDSQVDWFSTTGSTSRFVGALKTPQGSLMTKENMADINNFYQATSNRAVINAGSLLNTVTVTQGNRAVVENALPNIQELPSVGPWHITANFQNGVFENCMLGMQGASGDVVLRSSNGTDWEWRVPSPKGSQPGAIINGFGMIKFPDNVSPISFQMKVDSDGTMYGDLDPEINFSEAKNGESLVVQVGRNKMISWTLLQTTEAMKAARQCIKSGGQSSKQPAHTSITQKVPRTQPSSQNQGITVHSATYGANCGVAEGNVSKDIALKCNGSKNCSYIVDYLRLGDPAPNCAKDYKVTWTCSGDPRSYSTSATPEANGKTVALSCLPKQAHQQPAQMTGDVKTFTNSFTGENNCLTALNNAQVRLAQCTETSRLWMSAVSNKYGYYNIRSKTTGGNQCLTANGTEPLSMTSCDSSAAQSWSYKNLQEDPRYVQLQNMASGQGKCLDVINDEDKNRVYMVPCGYYSGQAWKLTAP